jgi:DNA invertase Pin-like site-specific DNA recombinase
MLGVFAEFETNLRRERQLEGIAKAKAAGVASAPTMRWSSFVSQLAKETGLTWQTVYRVKNNPASAEEGTRYLGRIPSANREPKFP